MGTHQRRARQPHRSRRARRRRHRRCGPAAEHSGSGRPGILRSAYQPVGLLVRRQPCAPRRNGLHQQLQVAVRHGGDPDRPRPAAADRAGICQSLAGGTHPNYIVPSACRGRERLWLDELRTYLEKVIRVRDIADSWTYCVVLNDERPGGGATFKEIVTDQLTYFHPYGTGGWPVEPPNFMAFRWNSAVQRIHRVIKADVVPHLQERYPYMTTNKNPLAARPHAVYTLGPQLPPYDPIPNGAPYRANRLWVLLDQLQTAPSLAQAIALTKQMTDAP